MGGVRLGEVKQPVVKQSTGLPYTMREIAMGEIEVDAFCPNCEVRVTAVKCTV